MRVKLSFNHKHNKDIILPQSTNEVVQALIYKILDPNISNFLHNQGYQFEKRTYKLFTFSRVHSQQYFINHNSHTINFGKEISFFVSSIDDSVILNFVKNQTKLKECQLGSNVLELKEVSVPIVPNFSNTTECYIKMLSPIVAYSDLENETTKKRYYFQPTEKEFSDLVRRNIIKKYISFYDKEPEQSIFNITPFRFNTKNDFVNVRYKETNIKGSMGIYKIVCSPSLIDFAFNVGIGSKNSQGFGMFDIWK